MVRRGARASQDRNALLEGRAVLARVARPVGDHLVWTVAYDFGEAEQARAEAHPGLFSRINVDGEAHPPAFDVELDDPPGVREVFPVADSQHRQPLDSLQSV